jgi:hypothetical protein
MMIMMYALVFRTTIVDVLVIFRIIAGHETMREQVTLQVESGSIKLLSLHVRPRHLI